MPKYDRESRAIARQQVREYRETVGKSVADLRTRYQMTQAELAEAANLPLRVIAELESGRYSATYLTIEKIAAVFGVNHNEISPPME